MIGRPVLRGQAASPWKLALQALQKLNPQRAHIASRVTWSLAVTTGDRQSARGHSTASDMFEMPNAN